MENILYIHEHQACFNYKQEANHFIQVKHCPPGTEWINTVQTTEVLIILEGNMHISFDFVLNKELKTGDMLLLAPGTQFKAETEKGGSVLVLYVPESVGLCNCFSLKQLKTLAVDKQDKPVVLQTKPILQTFLQGLMFNLQGGLRCAGYMKLKSEEFLILLQSYYTKDELVAFFYPVLHESSSFTDFILKNYRQVKKVNEFAQLYACSLSNFDKKFKKAFGISAYKWMKGKKMELIYHEINTTNKPFGQIAEEQGFLSLSQFTDFCKKNLGNSPGKIRRGALGHLQSETGE
ncbi:AraC family transcriptional regulator [Parabacteroides sp. 52]|uniref:helix-turn-helix transcriptional regulator n=1 Tax=unclassified Parabacteroides TaxID=2649774 RepID=UPI0013D686E2|nr:MULTISPECIES: AraC family transcriptional regulator [unclassified Parabacteroides]MDH6535194.1 AraC-like DNA-binding protein/mannose-6-phosphate isomerase-like protein (cupin superfamily) [Parabacteroides sp. PM5-20]NDV55443.1 AraC family transcriptional regulator [Parabacteroides sp. 52]